MSTKANTEKKEPEASSEEAPSTETPKPNTWREIIDGIFKPTWEEAERTLKERIPVYLSEQWAAANLGNYNPLIFIDPINSIGEEHADTIYSAINEFDKERDILLIISSHGGQIEPAYLISKNCQASSKNKFVVCVPRKAKSAATLIAIGADEIHMGSMSELGPIDPQFGRMPALALSNALTTISKLVCEHPDSAEMFSKYLSTQLDLKILGYFERINESAVQYAIRLLDGKKLSDKYTKDTLALHLVNHYKDHRFVIDKEEAFELFGEGIIKGKSPEYLFANKVDSNLRIVSRICRIVHEKDVTFVGSFSNCVRSEDVKKEE